MTTTTDPAPRLWHAHARAEAEAAARLVCGYVREFGDGLYVVTPGQDGYPPRFWVRAPSGAAVQRGRR